MPHVTLLGPASPGHPPWRPSRHHFYGLLELVLNGSGQGRNNPHQTRMLVDGASADMRDAREA